MNRRFIFLALSGALGFGMLRLQGQQPAGQTPAGQPLPAADPYANNEAAGTMKFPLAAPAGKDSGAIQTAAGRNQSGRH